MDDPELLHNRFSVPYVRGYSRARLFVAYVVFVLAVSAFAASVICDNGIKTEIHNTRKVLR